MRHSYHPTRRSILLQVAAGAAALCPSLQTLAQPSGTYRVVVGSPPGALGDVLARLVAQKLGEATGQPAIRTTSLARRVRSPLTSSPNPPVTAARC